MVQKIQRARELRQTATKAERILWSHIRAGKLQARFRRQHPIQGYFADFACVEASLIVELDGAHHADEIERDERRTQALEAAGWRVLRFWNGAVMEDPSSVVETILRELELARA